MNPLDNPRIAAVVKLLTADSLAIYIFYFSFLDVLASMGTFFYLWELREDKNERPGELNYCVLNDFWTAPFVPISSKYDGECISLSFNWPFVLNLGCVLLCACCVLFTAWQTIGKGGTDVCSGRFLACRIRASTSHGYKVLAALLVAYTPCVVLWGFYHHGILDLNHNWKVTMMTSFVFYQSTSLLAATASAASLVLSTTPRFDYENIEFEEARFRRTWVDLLLQPTGHFLAKLERALLLAHAGRSQSLSKLLEDTSQVEPIRRACTLHWDEDSDIDSEEDSDASGQDLVYQIKRNSGHAAELLREDLS